MTEQMSATRTIPAAPAAVFAVLTDPARHQETEPGDWVRDAIDPRPITASGQIFAVNMYLVHVGGDYVMHNKVTEFEPDTTIGWKPGQLDPEGNHQAGGWWWRYHLVPNGEATDVTLTYDWTDTPQEFRDSVPQMPPFPPKFLDKSLESLDKAVTGA